MTQAILVKLATGEVVKAKHHDLGKAIINESGREAFVSKFDVEGHTPFLTVVDAETAMKAASPSDYRQAEEIAWLEQWLGPDAKMVDIVDE